MFTPDILSRREALLRAGLGLGWLGAASLIDQQSSYASPTLSGAKQPSPVTQATLAPRLPHFEAKAKSVIHIFANGGPSHLDTFDPKPVLETWAGREIPGGALKTERRTGAALPSPFRFSRHGESGLEVSELFSHVARHADRMLVVRSMHADVPNHEPSLMLMNCGDARLSLIHI